MQWDDEYYMQQALNQAQMAFQNNEVPIGAIIVLENKIIAKAHNQVEQFHDPTAHAEIIAITSACNYLGAKYLPEAKLYVTIEPCLMCAGAIYWSKVQEVIYGGSDIKNGYSKHTGNTSPFHPKTRIKKGIMDEACIKLMQDFFRSKR
ncbi:MAG: nucleoside deaminase [Bacteroidetes bacterium]|nr:nucleoside deaminase [Bacteroidota bacterium]